MNLPKPLAELAIAAEQAFWMAAWPPMAVSCVVNPHRTLIRLSL